MSDLEILQSKSKSVAELLKVMSHPGRLVLLCLLAKGKNNVGSLATESQLSQSQTSQYLKLMTSLDILTVENQGKERIYEVKSSEVLRLLNSLKTIFCPEVL